MKTYKVVVVGDAAVGKTSFVRRLTTGDFTPNYLPTLGCDVEPYRHKQVCLNFWDCAGASQFQGLGIGYYGHANAAIIMFDTTSIRSFQSIKKWLALTTDIPVRVVCANKYDEKDRVVNTFDIQRLMRQCKAPGVEWFEISAKSMYNVPTVVSKIVSLVEDHEMPDPITNKPFLGRVPRSKL